LWVDELNLTEARPTVGTLSEALECVQLAAAFLPASLLAGNFNHSARVYQPDAAVSINAECSNHPASWLGEKAAASCTHSKASLSTPLWGSN